MMPFLPLHRRTAPAPRFRQSLLCLTAIGILGGGAILWKTPQAVALSEPGEVTNFSLAPQVTLIARPADSNYTVTSVRFLLDGRTLAEVGPPGRYEWSTYGLRPGRHIVQVQAFSGELLVGISEPTPVSVGEANGMAMGTLELPFPTYAAGRRVSSIPAPRLPRATSGSIAPATGDAASRISGLAVEVYLNGVKQDFAPVARLASADELRKAASRSVQSRSKSRTAQSRRTVWMPARPLLARLGARMRYETHSKTLRAELNIAGGTRRITLSTAGTSRTRGGTAYAEIDGHRFALQMPVRQADNAIMVPLEFCTQALNLRVNYQRSQRRVDMFTPITPA